jgi:hypothetical protein
MNKRIRINFAETAKTVQADTTIEVESEDGNYKEVLDEAKALFDEAFSYAQDKSMLKAKQ